MPDSIDPHIISFLAKKQKSLCLIVQLLGTLRWRAAALVTTSSAASVREFGIGRDQHFYKIDYYWAEQKDNLWWAQHRTEGQA